MKDITVQEFINTYNKKESDQEKQDYIKSMVNNEAINNLNALEVNTTT